MCFVIHGWARKDGVPGLASKLAERFAGRVALEEQQMVEQDLEKVPVALKNPPYVQPFELFTRMLQLPRYSSWDPTPFIAIFFPLFFGMMLGDAGHGLVLIVVALLAMRQRKRGALGDAARILLISASYAVLFGIIFGEFFGEAGAGMLHLHPLGMERSRAIMPMLIFSVTVGVVHVLLGMVLGLITSLRRHEHGEAMTRFASIGLIACLAAIFISIVHPSPWLLTRPILIVAAVLVPFLFLAGGFLAPLELLRYIGNIISYARIMAIGLSSVLLANAANHLAGLSGDLILGTVTAIVLHAVAIVLGAFAPAIHGLRLHFVEFLGKFVETGGKSFAPLRKED
jgi:V/A-type H+-transporting ATPase subunit I